jgi:hypothetical protein
MYETCPHAFSLTWTELSNLSCVVWIISLTREHKESTIYVKSKWGWRLNESPFRCIVSPFPSFGPLDIKRGLYRSQWHYRHRISNLSLNLLSMTSSNCQSLKCSNNYCKSHVSTRTSTDSVKGRKQLDTALKFHVPKFEIQFLWIKYKDLFRLCP